MSRAQALRKSFFSSRKLRLAPHAVRRSFFSSRKLRLAPQGYSPWTSPTDRLYLNTLNPHPQREAGGREY